MITATTLLKSCSAIALAVGISAAFLPSVASAQTATVWDGSDTAADGQIDGGNGTWTVNGTNWTNNTGAANAPYDPNGVLIFSGNTGGTITVDNSAGPITIAGGIRFETNGYTLTGGPLRLITPTNALNFGTIINIGGFTVGAAGITTNIASSLTGPSGMVKTGFGTLRLTGANTYFGETRVLAGNLIQSGGTLGGTAAESALRVAIDPGSTASLSVINGAVLTSTTATIASQTNSTGTVTVSGAGSRWSIVGQGGVRIGGGLSNARGLVEILDGGVLDYDAAFSFAPLSVANGSTVRVSGTDSRFDATATMLFNQGGGGGALTLENGGVARAENFEFGETSALTIRSGARLETTIGSSLAFGTGATMLVSGTGSRINSAGPFSFGGNTVRGGDLIIEDNAIVTSAANSDSGLGFDSGRNMIVRSGGQFNLTGGTGAGLQMENSNLLVDNASVTMGGGFLLGSRFGNNIVTLLNANLTAGSITARGSSVINVGGARTGAAGAVGIFDVADVSLVRFDSGVSAELNFNHTSTRYVIASKFAQNGRINLIAGNTVLTGDSAGFAGNTQVTGGSLIVNNRFGTNLSVVGVGAGATLGGTGTVGGTVTVTGGTIAAGDNGVGTLTINGSLILDAASRLAFQLGAPNTPGVGSDLINVTGNLTLDGTVDITNAGGFGAGLYRLINYTGTLTNNGLLVGAVPGGFSASDLTVQTSVARQVNLIVAAPPPAFTSFSFWDGRNTTANRVVDGGTGTWTAAGLNWTVSTGEANGAYDPAQLLIFAGTGGVVTADTAAGAIAVNRGLQFANTGYRIEGGDLTLANNAITLRVGDGTAAGAGIVATIASNLVGGASIEKTDLGTQILTGNVAPTGGTRITNGTLQIGAGGTGGTITGNIVNNGTLVLNRSGSLAYADVISGMGTLEQRGPGTLALSGVNSYTGTTTVSGGTLANSGTIVGATNVLAAGKLANAGTIAAVTNAGTGTNTGNMGALINNGGSFTNNGTIAGAVVNNTGAAFITTAILNGNLTNSGTARIGGTVNGALDNLAGTVTATAATSGIGALTQGAGAAFNLAGFPVTTGSVAGDGAVQLGSGALTTGGNNTNTAFAGTISGTGRFIKNGTGQLTLTGANTYSGGTTVAAGTLIGNTQSLQGAIINDGRVRFDQANSGTYAGALSGAGILEKMGAGRLEYTGTGSMSGETQVAGGEFAVNGALARSVVIVGSGARLSGGGTIGGIIAQSGSVVAPGNSVGTLNVQGNVRFAAGSTYAVEVIEGAADRITATGTAQLAGTLAITAVRGPYMFGTPYVLLSAAGGRAGTFDTTTGLAGFGPGIRSSVIYDGTSVTLRLDPNALGPILGATVLTPNQRSAQQRFDAAIANGSTNPSPFFPIFNLAVGQIPTALDALSGEVHATAARLALDDERMVRRSTIDQLRSAPAGTGSGAWGTVFGSYGKIASDGNAARITRDTSGFITGLDVSGTFGGEDNGWRVGVQAHHLRTTFGITDRAANGSLNRTGGGAYGSLNFGNVAIRGGAALASVRAKSARAITASGFAEQATSARKGTAFQAFGEIGYKIGDENTAFEPFAGLNLSRFRIGGITESGGVSAVTVNAADYDISFTELGLRGNIRIPTGETGVITLRSALAIRQVIGNRAHISDIAFASSPTLNFSIASVGQDKTSFAPELGIDGDLGGGLSVNVSYTGVIGKRAEDHGIKAGVRVVF